MRLVSKEDGKVSYETIAVRFSKVDANVQKLRDEGKVQEKIEIQVEESDGETSTESPDAKWENDT